MRGELLRYLGHRPVPIAPKRLATSQYSGEWPSPYSGRGMDFRSHRAFEPGDDPRTINMSMSVRAGKRMVVERIAMRDISIFVLLDCTPSMGVRRKPDTLALTAMMILASGLNMEMRIGAGLLGDGGLQNLGLGMGLRHANRLFDGIEAAIHRLQQGRLPSVSFVRQGLHRSLPAGCMLLYLSDFLTAAGDPQARLPLRLDTSRYDYIPVILQDRYEYGFPRDGDASLVELHNPETGNVEPVWLGPEQRHAIDTLHRKRFGLLQEQMRATVSGSIHVESAEMERVHHKLSAFFAYR